MLHFLGLSAVVVVLIQLGALSAWVVILKAMLAVAVAVAIAVALLLGVALIWRRRRHSTGL